MYTTYPAVLRGTQLEWQKETPPLKKNGAVRVYVTILEETPETETREAQGARMAQALETLVNLPRRSIVDVLAEAPGHLAFQSAEEVDISLREERNAWER